PPCFAFATHATRTSVSRACRAGGWQAAKLPAVNCYNCEQPATNACKRCAKPYCEDHGNAAYCAACLQPASAMPSFNLYRGALLAMLVGTALPVFLLVRPPGESGDAAPVVVNNARATPTPARRAS